MKTKKSALSNSSNIPVLNKEQIEKEFFKCGFLRTQEDCKAWLGIDPLESLPKGRLSILKRRKEK